MTVKVSKFSTSLNPDGVYCTAHLNHRPHRKLSLIVAAVTKLSYIAVAIKHQMGAADHLQL